MRETVIRNEPWNTTCLYVGDPRPLCSPSWACALWNSKTDYQNHLREQCQIGVLFQSGKHTGSLFFFLHSEMSIRTSRMSRCVWRSFVEKGSQGREKGKDQQKRNSVGPSGEKTSSSVTERKKCICDLSTCWAVGLPYWRFFGGKQSPPCWSLIQLKCDWFFEHVLILLNYFGLGFMIWGLPHSLKKWMHKLLLKGLFGERVGPGGWRGNSLPPLASPPHLPKSLWSLWLFSHCFHHQAQKLYVPLHLLLWEYLIIWICGVKGCTW